MTKRIVWQSPDGSLRITVPVEPPLEGESESAYLDRIALRTLNAVPSLADCVRLPDVDASELPSRRFRSCWRPNVRRSVAVDVPLARAQLLAEVRAERNVRLLASDADKQRLDDLGTPQQKQQLAAYRQALRDLPTSVQQDLEALTDSTALERYAPTWPAKP